MTDGRHPLHAEIQLCIDSLEATTEPCKQQNLVDLGNVLTTICVALYALRDGHDVRVSATIDNYLVLSYPTQTILESYDPGTLKM